MQFYVNWDARDFETKAKELGKALPYVEAAANSKTAVEIRDVLRRDLPKSFTLRNNWTQKSIRVGKWGTKADPEASVGSTELYLRRHIKGGVLKASTVFAVNNSRALKGSKRGGSGTMRSPTAWRARNRKLGAWNKFFEISSGRRAGIWKRSGKTTETRTTTNYFRYVETITMKPRWPFDQTCKAVHRDVYAKLWVEAVEQVMRRFAAKGRRT